MEKHIAIYERVSSKSQDLASQHCELMSWTLGVVNHVPIRWYSDKFSGKTMSRPGMDELMKDIRAGKVRKLLVWRLDRLGRTAKGLTALFEELQTLNVQFESMREGIDLSTPAGRLIAHVLASVAAYETEVRSERQMAGIAAAKASGKTWGGSESGRYTKRTPQIDQTVRDLKAKGEPVASIARIVKLSRPVIYQILKG